MKIPPDLMVRPDPPIRPKLRVGPLPNGAHVGLRAAVRLLFAPFNAFNVEGVGHIPRNGGFLLLPKHQRWVDIPYLGMACSRPLCYVAKVELFKTRLGSYFFRALGGIPLGRRPIATRHSLRAIRNALLAGHGVVLFPEGTYVPGRMGDGRSGLLRYLIKNTPVPLVPVGIAYTVVNARRTVTLRFGKAQSPAREGRVERLLNEILGRIADLSGLDA
jgi:1-acyl-sn-glycerol-3-phosphate acyltransferase